MHDAFFILASTWHYSLKRNDIWHYSLDKHVACQLTYIQSPRGGGSLHSQVEHHVQDKFATPILYGMDNFKFYDIFFTYT